MSQGNSRPEAMEHHSCCRCQATTNTRQEQQAAAATLHTLCSAPWCQQAVAHCVWPTVLLPPPLPLPPPPPHTLRNKLYGDCKALNTPKGKCRVVAGYDFVGDAFTGVQTGPAAVRGGMPVRRVGGWEVGEGGKSPGIAGCI